MKRKLLLLSVLAICVATLAAGTLAYFSAKGVVRKRQAEMATPCRVESYLVAQLDALSGDLLDACQAMSRALEAAPAADAGIDAARYYRDQVASRLEEMRSIIDRMEPLVGADYWPYPTYADILFSV